MRHFLTKLRVWFPPPLILVLFLVADVLTASPRFTFGGVNRDKRIAGWRQSVGDIAYRVADADETYDPESAACT